MILASVDPSYMHPIFYIVVLVGLLVSCAVLFFGGSE